MSTLLASAAKSIKPPRHKARPLRIIAAALIVAVGVGVLAFKMDGIDAAKLAYRLLDFELCYPGIACGFLLSLGCMARWFIVPTDRKRTEWVLVGVMSAGPFCNVALGITKALSHIRSLKYDEFVYRLDRIFVEPSFFIVRLVQHYIALHITLILAYTLLPFVIAGVFAVYLWGRS